MEKRNTKQKQVVENITLSRCDHPTAETIYLAAKKEIPNISLGTVYRILQELVEKGKVREVSIPSAPSRFDRTTKLHAHFVCKECGKVTDLMLDNEDLIKHIQAHTNSKIDEAELCFTGICEECIKNKK